MWCSPALFSVGTTSLFSIVVLALGILLANNGDDMFLNSAIYCILTSIVTLVALPAMFVFFPTIFEKKPDVERI